MTPQEFLEKVVCLKCRTKIDQKAPFNNGLVCNCRLSVCSVVKESKILLSYKLYISKDLMAYVSISEDPNSNIIFYVASPSRPFFPLLQPEEIPDYIFLPLDILIPKIELLTTFS